MVITYRDANKKIGPIKIFTKHSELNDIINKVSKSDFCPLSNSVFSPESYKFTDLLYRDYPELLKQTKVVKGEVVPLISKGHEKDLTSNVFDNLLNIVFFHDKPNSNEKFVRIMGRFDSGRELFWIKEKYIAPHDNLWKYKIFLPKSNGSGAFGEPLAESMIGSPGEGHTQTFISIGAFDTQVEAENLAKYLKSRFLRVMLGVLKVTQDNKKFVWSFVPNQDFSDLSDINWSVSVSNIDKQLYKKYSLSASDIEFIDRNVKEVMK